MNILLILAIFWPALAGLVIFLMPSCKDNRQLRGRAVNAALAVELALTLIMCLGQGTNMVLLNMTPTLRIEMNVDMVGCIFAVLMSTMWLLSSVFAREYMGHDGHERLYQVFFMCAALRADRPVLRRFDGDAVRVLRADDAALRADGRA